MAYHLIFLKRVAPAILDFLTHLFNVSLTTATVPNVWKLAFINPIFKKGSRSVPSNYRPISLTCCLSRVLENIIVKKLLLHLNEYSLISSFQYGFIPGKSSCT